MHPSPHESAKLPGACFPHRRTGTGSGYAGKGCWAFSLIELLSALGIISVLAVLGMVGFQSVGSGQNFARHVAELSDTIALARDLARTEGATVWLGIAPQQEAPDHLSVRAYMVMDGGTRPVDETDFLRVGKDRVLKMTALEAGMGATETEARPDADVNIPAGGAWIVLGPSGEVRAAIPAGSMDLDPGADMENLPEPGKGLYRLIEIGLRPSHGGNPGNTAAVQISGLTGAVSVYKP